MLNRQLFEDVHRESGQVNKRKERDHNKKEVAFSIELTWPLDCMYAIDYQFRLVLRKKCRQRQTIGAFRNGLGILHNPMMFQVLHCTAVICKKLSSRHVLSCIDVDSLLQFMQKQISMNS